ncbi:hypothetical protein Misp01_58130 [Microtetraspora sp. NBRC 13810]|uniref:YqeB family protein n=1 Tax=Microtetraspora sp. NBRC 13810 TaxID=3030990 RepID=UPI0024A071B1|nr:hypothetical protein [Microtetraspora sp. NBRC 13810]GLW10685.1 hypothetical protein Misp01_58130 [Microtetraspora sp. NBRC 13810]
MAHSSPDRQPAVVRHGAGTHLFLWTVFPLLGAAAGWVLSRLPGWIMSIPAIPPMEKVEFLARFLGAPVTTAVLVVVGVVAGGVLALTAYDDIVTVEVGPGTTTITRSGQAKTFSRDLIDGVFVDGKDLVLLGPDTEELAREKTDHNAEKLRSAFHEHRYPWLDRDPHRDEFQRWVDGMPGLDGHAQAVLRARQTALEAKDSADIAELRTELAKLGIVVRDVESRQYWRPAPSRRTT